MLKQLSDEHNSDNINIISSKDIDPAIMRVVNDNFQ